MPSNGSHRKPGFLYRRPVLAGSYTYNHTQNSPYLLILLIREYTPSGSAYQRMFDTTCNAVCSNCVLIGSQSCRFHKFDMITQIHIRPSKLQYQLSVELRWGLNTVVLVLNQFGLGGLEVAFGQGVAKSSVAQRTSTPP